VLLFLAQAHPSSESASAGPSLALFPWVGPQGAGGGARVTF
jgi:hypothetical protein